MAISGTGEEQDFDYGLRNLNPQLDSDPLYMVTQAADGTYGVIEPTDLHKDVRVAVNDSNYIISGTKDHLIAYTAITTDRTVTLPPATNSNQRIWITDESGLCSNARRIIVMPDGSDVIGGDSFAVINFPNGSGYLESNGSGKWNIISTTSIQFSSGVNTMPTITDNGNGSVTLGTGVYSLFANTNGVGRPKAYQVAGGTFTLTDNSTNFIYAEYNTTTGVVSLAQTTTETPINDLTQILIYAAYRSGTTLHPRNFDTWGVALINKINRSIYRTQRIRFEEGSVQIGETATPAQRTITITGGTVWIAAAENTLAALTSAANTCYHVIQTSPGVYTTNTVVTQYNNTQYNTTSGLQTLTNNNYAVNWVYRSVGTDNDMAIVLGNGDFSLGAAQTSLKPSGLPTFMRHMELVGRIIVQKNATTATQIDNVSTGVSFSSAGVTDHNALLNLQTAQTGVTYGHVTDSTQTIVGDKTLNGLATFQGTTLSDGGQLGSDIAGATTASGTNWTGTNFLGGYSHAIGSTTALVGTLAASNGQFYFISWTVTGRTAGTFILSFGGFSQSGISATGSNGCLTSSTAVLTLTPTTDFDGTVAISIKVVSNSSPLISTKDSSATLIGEVRTPNSTSIAIGKDSGRKTLSTTVQNSFYGSGSGRDNISGINNTFLGVSTGTTNVNTNYQTLVGHGIQANSNYPLNVYRTYLGGLIGGANDSSSLNTFVGWNIANNGSGITSGSNNIAMGYNSLFNITSGNANISLGPASGLAALYNLTTGNNNTALGIGSLMNITTQSDNTAIGRDSAKFIADGTTANTSSIQSIYIGNNTKSSAVGNTNEIVVGYNAIGNGSNTATIGNSSVTDTFLQGQKLNIRNVAKTFWGTITHTITAARTWTMPDVSGTVMVNGATYKVYRTLINQTSVNNPILTDLDNTTGATMTATRNGVGDYTLTANVATFQAGFTHALLTNASGNVTHDVTISRTGTTTFAIKTYVSGTLTDAVLTDCSLQVMIKQ